MQNRARLRQKNLRALRPYLRPKIQQLLASPHVEPPAFTVVGDMADGTANILSGSGPLYSPDALTYARNQVTAYAQKPTRILFDRVDAGDNNAPLEEFLVNLHSRTKELERQAPSSFGGYLVSVGCGLGFHLPMLLDRFNFRNLIIVESVFDLFEASLEILDWGAIVKTIEKRGGHITLIFNADPATASQLTVLAMRDKDHALVEGSYFFQHHAMQGCDVIAQQIGQSQGAILDYNGWLDDELQHLRNHIGNCSQGKWLTVGERNSVRKDCPAYIVGSGPSLNSIIERLKVNQDKAVIFSCGSALRALLSAGIKPDFHVELENVSLVARMLAETAKEFDISDITLLASTTVDPAVPAHFAKTIFFLRDSNAIVRLLSESHHQLQHSARSVTNSAVALAHAFGFCEIVLCGADFGTVSAKEHHAKGALYHEAKGNKREEMGGGSAGRAFRHKVRGNLRESVYTNDTFVFMRNGLAHLAEILTLAFPDFKIYNASDGAFIDHATPIQPNALPFGETSEAKAAIIAAIHAGFIEEEGNRTLTAATNRLATGFAGWLKKATTSLERQKHLHDDAQAANGSIRDLLLSFAPLLVDEWDQNDAKDPCEYAVRNVVTGTIMRALHIAHHDCLQIAESNHPALKAGILLSLEKLLHTIGVRIIVDMLNAGCEVTPEQWPEAGRNVLNTQNFLEQLFHQPNTAERPDQIDGEVFRLLWPSCPAHKCPQETQGAIETVLTAFPDDELILLALLESCLDLEVIRNTEAGKPPTPDQAANTALAKRILSHLKSAECTHPQTANLCRQLTFWMCDYQAAVDWGLREVDLCPDNGMAIWSVAISLVFGGAVQDALPLFRGICKTLPTAPSLECYASLAEYVGGNERQAIAEWMHLVEDSPGLELAQAFLDGSRDLPNWDQHKVHGDIWLYKLSRKLFDIARTNNTAA